MRRRVHGTAAREAFSLVEVAVASGLALLLVGVLAAALGLGRRGEVRSDEDQLLSAALLARDRIEYDLLRVVVRAHHRSIHVSEENDAIGLWVSNVAGGEATGLSVLPVSYSCDRRGVARREARREERVASPYLKRVHITSCDDRSAGAAVRLRLSLATARSTREYAFSVRLRVPRVLDVEGLAEAYPFRMLADFSDGLAPRPRTRDAGGVER